jgi:hypothetical protein
MYHLEGWVKGKRRYRSGERRMGRNAGRSGLTGGVTGKISVRDGEVGRLFGILQETATRILKFQITNTFQTMPGITLDAP